MCGEITHTQKKKIGLEALYEETGLQCFSIIISGQNVALQSEKGPLLL